MRMPIPYVCPICGSRLPRAASRCFFCENPLPLDKSPATARRISLAGDPRRDTDRAGEDRRDVVVPFKQERPKSSPTKSPIPPKTTDDPPPAA